MQSQRPPQRDFTATALRADFKALPSEQRNANQPFAIRVWRGLSWLERAQAMPDDDPEGRFISSWIGFNAIYGRLDDDGRPWGDRSALGAFLAHLWRIDQHRRLWNVLQDNQTRVLSLIENKFLYARFWDQGEAVVPVLRQEMRQAINLMGTPNTLPVLQKLFERLYVLRVQIFHGASTKGSKLNRQQLKASAGLMLKLLPEMLVVMIDHGVGEDWGAVCFAPVGE